VKRVELLLEPPAAASLDALVEHFKVSRVEVISRLIAKAAKRIAGKSQDGSTVQSIIPKVTA
jgi:hypothetical protein